MRHTLTDAFLKAVKPPAIGRLDIADLRCAGLSFRITAAGACSFNFRFRDPHSGRTTRATIGTYPAVPLAKARARAEELRRQIAAGVNPANERRREREEAHSKTFGALAERFMREHARRMNRPHTIDVNDRTLRLHVLPLWGDRRYDQIGRGDVIELSERLIAEGKPALARRTQALVSSIFSFAIDAGLLQANPCFRLRKRAPAVARSRTLTDDELRLFWRCAVLPPVSRRVGLALRLCLLTGMRAGEAAGLRRAEIEHLDDPERAALTIAGERTKNGRDHFVPLSPLAVETVREAIELAGDRPHVFGVEPHSLAVAMRRMADKLPHNAVGADGWKADPPTPHDLRRTAATRMASLGIAAEDVSACLGHTPQHITKQVYDRYDRAREKRIALNAWSAALTSLVTST